jgi:hypothetical protein
MLVFNINPSSRFLYIFTYLVNQMLPVTMYKFSDNLYININIITKILIHLHTIYIILSIYKPVSIKSQWHNFTCVLINHQQIVSFVRYDVFRALLVALLSAEWTVWFFLREGCFIAQYLKQKTLLNVFQNFSLNQQYKIKLNADFSANKNKVTQRRMSNVSWLLTKKYWLRLT